VEVESALAGAVLDEVAETGTAVGETSAVGVSLVEISATVASVVGEASVVETSEAGTAVGWLSKFVVSLLLGVVKVGDAFLLGGALVRGAPAILRAASICARRACVGEFLGSGRGSGRLLTIFQRARCGIAY
jgi:hypothetical protein